MVRLNADDVGNPGLTHHFIYFYRGRKHRILKVSSSAILSPRRTLRELLAHIDGVRLLVAASHLCKCSQALIDPRLLPKKHRNWRFVQAFAFPAESVDRNLSPLLRGFLLLLKELDDLR